MSARPSDPLVDRASSDTEPNTQPSRPFMVRGVRGATTVEYDEPALIAEATYELLTLMLRANQLDDLSLIASIFFTTTSDLCSTFPAEAARDIPGMSDVPLICTQEIPVPNRLARAVRIMMHVNTQKTQQEIKHVYLREAVRLRPDLTENP